MDNTLRELLKAKQETFNLRLEIHNLEQTVQHLTGTLKREYDKRREIESRHQGCLEIRRIAAAYSIPQEQVLKMVEEVASQLQGNQK